MNDKEFRAYWAVIPARVLYSQKISSTAKLLYADISTRSGEQGCCWPTNGALADVFQVGERTITRLLNELEREKAIVLRYTGGGDQIKDRSETHHFGREIWLPDAAYLTLDKNVEGRQKCLGGVDKNVHPLNKVINNKNKKYISGEIPKEILDRLSAYAEDDAPLLDALRAFVEMRAKTKTPMRTERAAVILLNTLTRCAGTNNAEKIAMLEKATLAGWSGVYPLSDREKAALGPRETPQEQAEPVSETRRKELDGEWY